MTFIKFQRSMVASGYYILHDTKRFQEVLILRISVI